MSDGECDRSSSSDVPIAENVVEQSIEEGGPREEEESVSSISVPALAMRLPPATSTVAVSPRASSSSSPVEPPPPPHTWLPLGVAILAAPNTLERFEDASAMIPSTFAEYKGPGGESVRAMYYSMLAEYRTNADDTYNTQGTIKTALFVTFLELCRAFTSEMSDEICNVITTVTMAFMGSIRGVFKTSVHSDLSQFQKAARDSVGAQLGVALQIFPDVIDLRSFGCDVRNFLNVPSAVVSEPTNMFRIMHEISKCRDCAFYTYAKFVQGQIVNATKDKQVYIAHIFLYYFIYTMVAVCRLTDFDYTKTREEFKNADDKAVAYYKHKINSQLHTSFGDLSSYLVIKQFNFETDIQLEYQRHVSAAMYRSTKPAPAASADKFQPQMEIPVDPAQQGSSCLIL